MTTIAFDGKTMAADLRASSGTRILTVKTKLRRLPDGAIAGACGVLSSCSKLLDWLCDKIEDDELELSVLDDDGNGAEALVAYPSGELYLYDSSGHPTELGERKYAIGSGGDYALAWMEANKKATARSAVKYAMSRDSGTGNGIQVMRFRR